MDFVNRHLSARYTNGNGTFVTAFYGILDPAKRELTYASAGHPAPRVRHMNGKVGSIAVDRGGLPLGIEPDEQYRDVTARLAPGDLILFYTDGITEARSEGGEMFEVEGIDRALADCMSASAAVERVTGNLAHFCGCRTPNDDQTLIAVRFD